MTNNLIQPKGSVSTETNKQSIARFTGVKQNEVEYLVDNLDVSGLKYLYDPSTETVWEMNGNELGTVNTWIITNNSLSLETDKNTYILKMANENILLKTEISSYDGFKYIGKCENITTLRNTEPTEDQQQIILYKYLDSGPIINCVLTYDKMDTTTPDDDFSVFVTNNGARWKANIESGFDIRLAGYSKTLNNFSESINKIISSVVTKIVSNGNFTTQQCEINIYSDSEFTSDSPHIANSTMYLPTFFTLNFHGGKHIIKTNKDITIFKIDNAQFFTSHGLTWQMLTSGYADGTTLKSNARKQNIFKSNGLWMMGIGTTSTMPGVILGQTDTVTNSGLDCDVQLQFLNISKFYSGIQFGTTNTYNLYIDNCYFDGVSYGVYIPNGVNGNAGETIHISNSTITAGQSYGNVNGIGVYSDAFAYNLSFSKCHIDYCSKSVLSLGPHTSYSHFRFDNCWIEGFEKLITCSSMFVGNVPRIYFNSVEFEMRTTNTNVWGGPRKILDTNDFYTVSFDSCTFTYYRKPGINSTTIAFSGTDTKPMGLIRYGTSYFGAINSSRASRPYPIDIASSIRGLALFSGTEGTNAINSYDNSQLSLITSGSPTVVYGPSTDVNSQFQSIAITLSATTDIVYIYPRHKIFLQRGESIAGSCSVKLNSAVGNVYISTCLMNYYNPTLSGTVSGSTVTINKTPNLNATVQGVVIEDVLTYLNETNTTLTKNNFVGVEPTWVSQTYSGMLSNDIISGYDFSFPATKITGFTGTIYISLPFWWKV